MKDNKTKNINKNNVSKNKKKAKLNVGLIVSLILILGCIIAFYIMFGIEFALITTVGIFVILFFARLLDLTKKKKRQRKLLKGFLIIFLTFAIIGMIGATSFLVYVVTTAPEFNTSLLKSSSK